jgi:hypothetical protein
LQRERDRNSNEDRDAPEVRHRRSSLGTPQPNALAWDVHIPDNKKDVDSQSSVSLPLLGRAVFPEPKAADSKHRRQSEC